MLLPCFQSRPGVGPQYSKDHFRSLRRLLLAVTVSIGALLSLSGILMADEPRISPELKTIRETAKRYQSYLEANQGSAGASTTMVALTRLMIRQAELEPDLEESVKIRELARGWIQNATARYQSQLASAEEKVKSFPAFIDRQREPERVKERQAVLAKVISTQVQIAHCMMFETLTFATNSDEFEVRMKAAADRFETLHKKYRSQFGGLLARLWQARCLQYLTQDQAALGIYGEIMSHPGGNDSMRRLKSQATVSKVVLLSEDSKRRRQAIVEGLFWWDEADGRERKTAEAASIVWEVSLAMAVEAGAKAPTRPILSLMGTRSGPARIQTLKAAESLLGKLRESGGKDAEDARRVHADVRAILRESKP